MTAMLAFGLIDVYRVWQYNRQQLMDSLKKRTELAAIAFEQWANSQQEPLATLSEILEDKPIRSIIIESNLLYLLETRPLWLNLQIVDSNGNKLLSQSKGKEPPKSLIEDLLNEVNKKKVWVLTTDRTESEKNPIFTFATPTKDGGAVIAQIDGEAVKGLFRDIELSENTVVSILSKDGKVLYRRVLDDVSLSSDIVGTDLIESLGTERINVAEIKSPYDGITRVYGLARTEKADNVVVIGISSHRFYNPLWQQMSRQFLIGFFILLISVVFTLFLAYSIMSSLRKLKKTAYQFAFGNRTAKAPENITGEIGELGKAFNWMAEQINQREDRLKELDQLKSEFVSSVSHELKTPLTTIKTLAHVLKENKGNEKEKAEYLDVISAECDRQIILVSNILDVSQIESGKFNYECSDIDLNQVLQEVYTIEKTSAQLKNIQLKLQVEKNLPSVWANSEALHRIFRSLIENAIKYTADESKIIISAEKAEKEVAISIMDNGCGIISQDLPYLFDKFYRGRPNSAGLSSNNETGGAGLGLYIAKKIVEQLNGRITVKNGLSGGAVFTVHLSVSKGNNYVKTSSDSG